MNGSIANTIEQMGWGNEAIFVSAKGVGILTLILVMSLSCTIFTYRFFHTVVGLQIVRMYGSSVSSAWFNHEWGVVVEVADSLAKTLVVWAMRRSQQAVSTRCRREVGLPCESSIIANGVSDGYATSRLSSGPWEIWLDSGSNPSCADSGCDLCLSIEEAG